MGKATAASPIVSRQVGEVRVGRPNFLASAAGFNDLTMVFFAE